MTEFKKGQQGVYTSGSGNEYTAYVLTAHQDGDVTIRICHPIVRGGDVLTYAYQGDKFRVGPSQFRARA
jgi:hypothetical protein